MGFFPYPCPNGHENCVKATSGLICKGKYPKKKWFNWLSKYHQL